MLTPEWWKERYPEAVDGYLVEKPNKRGDPWMITHYLPNGLTSRDASKAEIAFWNEIQRLRRKNARLIRIIERVHRELLIAVADADDEIEAEEARHEG